MMDRPEWIDTFPDKLTATATLTNNNRRGSTPASSNNPNGTTFAGSARPPVDATNPRPINNYGHIVTWSYYRDWTEPTFRWDIFALAGDPATPAHGATIVGDKYGSPDDIYVAPSGRLWIQTDVSTSTINAGAYAGFGNNQMLCADPHTCQTRRARGRARRVSWSRRTTGGGSAAEAQRGAEAGRSGAPARRRPS